MRVEEKQGDFPIYPSTSPSHPIGTVFLQAVHQLRLLNQLGQLSIRNYCIIIVQFLVKLKASVTLSCLTLCHHMTGACRVLCPWNSPGKNTGVGCHFFLQGIFLTQGSRSLSGPFIRVLFLRIISFSFIAFFNVINRIFDLPLHCAYVCVLKHG